MSSCLCVDRIQPLDIDRFLHRLAKKVSSVSVTGDIYGHLDDESQKSALSVLSGKILMAFMAQSSGTSLSIEAGMLEWSGWLNSRPLDPQSSALPSCAIARCY